MVPAGTRGAGPSCGAANAATKTSPRTAATQRMSLNGEFRSNGVSLLEKPQARDYSPSHHRADGELVSWLRQPPSADPHHSTGFVAPGHEKPYHEVSSPKRRTNEESAVVPARWGAVGSARAGREQRNGPSGEQRQSFKRDSQHTGQYSARAAGQG